MNNLFTWRNSFFKKIKKRSLGLSSLMQSSLEWCRIPDVRTDPNPLQKPPLGFFPPWIVRLLVSRSLSSPSNISLIVLNVLCCCCCVDVVLCCAWLLLSVTLLSYCFIQDFFLSQIKTKKEYLPKNWVCYLTFSQCEGGEGYIHQDIKLCVLSILWTELTALCCLSMASQWTALECCQWTALECCRC